MQASFCRALAQEILDSCLSGLVCPAGTLRQLLECAANADPDLAREGSQALFQIIAEGLADRFEPRLADPYAEVFSQAIAAVAPGFDPAELMARHRRIGRVRAFQGEVDRIRRVYILSRVTLGADIAVTSVVLDAAKRRFPSAEIFLAGGEKSWALFSADSRLQWRPVSYGREGTLPERIAMGPLLAAALAAPDNLVIDPDSRLTQLGLLPICREENYYLFDSRSYGGDGQEPLTALTQRWVHEVFGVPDAAPYIAPAEAPALDPGPVVAVNLGVGENLAKHVPDPFEEELLRGLLSRGHRLVIDLGAGGEEESRVRRAIDRCGAADARVRTWRGSFAGFAAIIARSQLYVGYDSAGQHAAAVCGTPLVTVFSGFASPRMFARWQPVGPGPKEIIRVDTVDPQAVLERTLAAANRLLGLTYTSRR